MVIAAYNTETKTDYPIENNIEARTIGYSWIWYHPEQWLICLIISLFSAVVFVYGLLVDLKKSRWSIRDFIKIEIVNEEEKLRKD
ncbi:hypothetical protein KJN74_03560 [Candidatus Bathyarchaeota archaeon]|nr:hypothetical protein [Candidatus Bathyarchaeota archaeon]